MSYTNVLFLIFRNKPFIDLSKILLLIIGAGCYWEFVGPFLKTTSVTDVFDLLSYLTGSLFYYFSFKKIYSKAAEVPQ